MILDPEPLTAEAFAPFGRVIERPSVGCRRPLSDLVEVRDPAARLTASWSCVGAADPPVRTDRMERHPLSAQLFLPIDAARYLLVIAGDRDGRPADPATARALVVPGDLGIVYAPATWHRPMVALDRAGSFVVLMGRSGTDRDEEWADLPEPLEVVAVPPER